ncbi:DNA replication licensing factor mcm7 [Anaeramoeba flamelloides]|uniref:DNA replication licensing factor MCM7 n=1 Tax=Anaeramoeba flamelloides TaxID=1746091 RepID=A0AAV7ZK33_9EUKA|nr:DNA replication licensing factor mcm7 [Anaeramoeba flamelloides]KAJ6231727.1 DNA replication licensing factor mcm7 [Anaeramoeba flamelloides]
MELPPNFPPDEEDPDEIEMELEMEQQQEKQLFEAEEAEIERQLHEQEQLNLQKELKQEGQVGGQLDESIEKEDEYIDVYQSIRSKFKEFLLNYKDFEGELKYMKKLYKDEFFDIVDEIELNTMRYMTSFSEAVDEIMPTLISSQEFEKDDVYDILTKTRIQKKKNDPFNEDKPMFPSELLRRFELQFQPRNKMQVRHMRSVKASSIGKMVKIRGIVTRITEVKPRVKVATYTCEKCPNEIYQEVNGSTFMPLQACPVCEKNGVLAVLNLQTRGSKFIKFQEIKLQEMSDEVPIGHIPRIITVNAHGEHTRKCTAGDVITITGVFLPRPFKGFRAITAGLVTETYLEVLNLEKMKQRYQDHHLSEEDVKLIKETAQNENIYTKLSKSLAPEIWGHSDIKRALLLLLVSGVNKEFSDGMRIRGNINVLLIGDPGVAKSQLLKHISNISPRGIYTTGKGSSGVGLTAAVLKDQTTGERVLEGGALVLADKGVTCIDEFDKMDERDRTAIHEVMEQQTVSVAKAGITTTLNARTSILAAANPLFGRYNPNRTVIENINLPTALMSRFDLIFLILDKPNLQDDLALARHVTFVHQYGTSPDLDFEPFSAKFLRSYIAYARTFNPSVPKKLMNYIAEAYVSMRKSTTWVSGMQNTSRYKNARKDEEHVTPRTLLSILRLAQALARLRFASSITKQDVEEAIRLLHISKASIALENEISKKKNKYKDYKSTIYHIIRDSVEVLANEKKNKKKKSKKKKHKKSQDNSDSEEDEDDEEEIKSSSHTINYDEILNKILKRGFSKEQLNRTLEDYEKWNILQLNPRKTKITIVLN